MFNKKSSVETKDQKTKFIYSVTNSFQELSVVRNRQTPHPATDLPTSGEPHSATDKPTMSRASSHSTTLVSTDLKVMIKKSY